MSTRADGGEPGIRHTGGLGPTGPVTPVATDGPARSITADGTTALYVLAGSAPVTLSRRAAALALRPLPEQEKYSSRAEVTLPAADADPHRTPFLVEHAGQAVGFGVIDAVGYLSSLTHRPGRAALLRAFYIGAQFQYRGHGRTAARLLPGLVGQVVPAARWLYLTVNEANPAGIRAYAAGGFTDVGRYLGGGLGPQRVMRVAVLTGNH
ncbi:GNAT family N-acetyltransferase [Georgenia yuyongxinii]|uniref:GNAT family N-acetyltransferase n=1 Tax=Georgenia yuyongxinii TaxID=2589797 RepID=A0A552WRJ6_9MICO|nr:GNAT family N-acetyltransferase [Georgenia yuyongxinii]TRW45431.1 GNAT family N-acetyltransferase [Georgenia yuyongxinii]